MNFERRTVEITIEETNKALMSHDAEIKRTGIELVVSKLLFRDGSDRGCDFRRKRRISLTHRRLKQGRQLIDQTHHEVPTAK